MGEVKYVVVFYHMAYYNNCDGPDEWYKENLCEVGFTTLEDTIKYTNVMRGIFEGAASCDVEEIDVYNGSDSDKDDQLLLQIPIKGGFKHKAGRA